MKLITLKHSEIKPNKNPRKNFTGIEELRENIKRVGITTPLIVDLKHRLINGERRWRATKGLLKELPCIEVDRKDWDRPDVRLEIQISIDAMTNRWNIVDKAKAWKDYLDMGHTYAELIKLNGHKSESTSREVVGLLNSGAKILNNLEKDDTNWSWHSDIERIGKKLPERQRTIIHQRIFAGAYENRDDLRESLKLAVDNPQLVEKIVKATSPLDRQMIEFGATTKPERVERKFVPKAKTKEEEQIDYEKRLVMGLVSALNSINTARILWARTDAVELVKKHLSKKQFGQVIESVATIVKVWTKTLRDLKK